MNTKILAKVTADRQLEFVPEIQAQLQPGDQYTISFRGDAIILEKVSTESIQPVNLEVFFERLDQAEPDAEQPTLTEISLMVKSVRHNRRPDS